MTDPGNKKKKKYPHAIWGQYLIFISFVLILCALFLNVTNEMFMNTIMYVLPGLGILVIIIGGAYDTYIEPTGVKA
jgi:hypothetical protein